jgi:hypothetical protein
VSVWLGFLFAAVTIVKFSASDIVTNNLYIVFYLIMAYAVIKGAGQLDPVYRISYRVDVLERRNSAAGFYLGARTLAIALIFAGSIIGEGPGFYVVLAFFAAGWLTLEITVFLLCRMRHWNLRRLVGRDSNWASMSLIASWYFSGALVLRWACGGDFQGWEIAFRDFATKASPLFILFVFFLFRLSPAREAFVVLCFGALFIFRTFQ